MVLWHLFLGFLRVGLLGFGGGPASIPLVQIEAVQNYHWLTITQFSDVLALANALPGPLLTKMAGLIGFQQDGAAGALVALFAAVLPTAVAMVVLLRFLHLFRESPVVRGLTAAIRPAIALLLALLVLDLVGGTVAAAGWPFTLAVAGAALVALRVRRVHPALVVVAALGLGAIWGVAFLG